MSFNVEGARKAGYSDAEIADYLGKEQQFDTAAARKAGYGDEELIAHLSAKAAAPKPREIGLTEGFGRGLGGGFSATGNILALAGAAPFVLADKVAGTNSADKVFEYLVDPTREAEKFYDLKEGETAGIAGKVGLGLGNIVSAAPAIVATGGAAAPEVVGGTAVRLGLTTLARGGAAAQPIVVPQAGKEYQDLTEAGMAPADAARVTGVDYGVNTALNAIPLGLTGKLRTRVGVGAATGAAGVPVANEAHNAALPEGAQRQETTAEDMLVEGGLNALMGGAFGHNPAAAKTAVPTRVPGDLTPEMRTSMLARLQEIEGGRDAAGSLHPDLAQEHADIVRELTAAKAIDDMPGLAGVAARQERRALPAPAGDPVMVAGPDGIVPTTATNFANERQATIDAQRAAQAARGDTTIPSDMVPEGQSSRPVEPAKPAPALPAPEGDGVITVGSDGVARRETDANLRNQAAADRAARADALAAKGDTAVPADMVPTAKPGAPLIVRSGGDAWKGTPEGFTAVSRAVKARGLEKTHAVVKTDDGFAIAPKDAVVEAAPAEPARMRSPDDVARDAFRERAARHGLSEDALADLAPASARDSVTEWHDVRQGTAKTDVIKEAQAWVRASKKPAHFVSMDLQNLGGLNEFHKNVASAANKDFRGIADIVKEELSAISPDAVLMRTGGDELGAVVPGVAAADVRRAMDRARERIQDYAKQQGFDDIPHAKGKPTRGVNVYYGMAEIKPGREPGKIFDRADAEVDQGKSLAKAPTENVDVAREEAGTAGPGAHDRETGSGDRGRLQDEAGAAGPGTAAAGRGARSQPSAEPVKAPAAEAESPKKTDTAAPAAEQDPAGIYHHKNHADVTVEVTKTEKGYSVEWAPDDVQEFRGKHAVAKVAAAMEREGYGRQKAGAGAFEAAGRESAASPDNDLQDPSLAQREAGNFKMGHVQAHGLDFTVEVPKGGKRKGISGDGKPWEREVADHYGYIKRTTGADGENVDVWVGPDAEAENPKVFVVDQVHADGSFDEHKVMFGYPDEAAARAAYLKNFPDGWKGLGDITKQDLPRFKEWLSKGDMQAPLGEAVKPRARGDRIEDFGEKIGGAKKELWQTYNHTLAEELPQDLASVTLSKHFPEPDYEKLIAAGVPADSLAAIKAMRDLLPAKPRSSWKLSRWVGTLRLMRDLSSKLLDGRISAKNMRTTLNGMPRDMSALADKIEIYMGVGYPGFLKADPANLRYGTHFTYEDGKQTAHPDQYGAYFNSSRISEKFFKEKADAIGAIRDFVSGLADQKGKPRQTRLDIYRVTDTGKVMIGKQIATNRYIDLKAFDTAKEARAYLVDHETELQAQLQQYREQQNNIPSRRSTNDPRKGEDYRRGEDVAPEKFGSTFGFRGVEFGNWVEQGRRQRDLNDAYDALMDMAKVIGIPSKAISLNGSLGLAFGARGHGRAAAHYEPDRIVINLTKKEGAGALGHEWWHAMDNYFSRQRSKPAGMISSRPHELEQKGVRPEVLDAFGRLMKTLNASEMVKRSKALDRHRPKDYWSTPEEISARAFESYLIAKAKERGDANDYLANVLDEKAVKTVFEGAADDWPYPFDNEMGPITEAFDNLFRTIKTRDDGDNVALYSKGKKAAAGGMRAEQVSNISDTALKRFRKDGLTLKVVQSQDELPAAWLRSLTAEDTVHGALEIHKDGAATAWLVADNLKNRDTVLEKLSHEVIGHYGVMKLLGSDFDSIVAQVHQLKGAGNAEIARYADEVATNYGALDKRTEAAEIIAHMAEGELTSGPAKRLWQTVMSAVRRALAKLGLVSQHQVGDVEIRAMIRRAAEALREPAAEGDVFLDGVPLFAKKGRNGSDRAEWHDDFPNAIFATPLGKAKDHADYDAAKGGDWQAAGRLVQDIVPDDRVEAIRAALGDRKPVVMPVVAQEATGANKLPRAYAEYLAAKLGLETGDGIIQSVKVGRTGQDSNHRLAMQPVFDGEVKAGQDYLIVDDTMTMGGTLANLRGHIEAGGGKVVLASALTGHLGTDGPLAISKAMRDAIWQKHGKPLDDYLREEFGYGIDQLTQGEAGHFRKAATLDEIRDRIAEARRRAGEGGPAGDVPQDVNTPPLFSRQKGASAGHLDAGQMETLKKIGAFADKEPIAQTAKRLMAGWQSKLAQGLVDQFAPLKDLDSTAYMQARLSKGTDGALEALFKFGLPKLTDGALDVKADGHGLQGVLSKLDGEHDLFFAWIAGNRAKRLKEQGRENLFTGIDIDRLTRLNLGKMDDGRSRVLAYADAHKAFNDYQRAVLDIAAEAGLIDPEMRKQWESDFYVPFYRIMDEDVNIGPGQVGGLVRQRAFQKLKGGTDPLGDLLSNTLSNWSHLLTASMKNMAAAKALGSAEAMGIAERVPAAEKGSIWAMHSGQQQHYLVHDQMVLDALTMLHNQGFKGSIMDAMRTMKHVLTTGVTISPTFRVRNLIRDSISALSVSDLKFNPMLNIVEGWKGTAHDSETFQRLVAGGGAVRFGSLNDGQQAANAKRLIRSGVKDEQILDTKEKVRDAFKAAWDWWAETGDRGESINRSALYQQLRDQGKNHLEASYAARDLMDFTMSGKWAAVRFLSQVVPFFNARLQGMYKLTRGAKTNPARFAAVAGAVGMASAALYLFNKDDEDFKNLPDWVRDNYWWVKLYGTDKALYIPKPFEIGALGSIVERGTELATAGTDYEAMDFANTLSTIITQNLSLAPGPISPLPLPQALIPVTEVMVNKDSFRERPIDSPGQQRLPAGDRSNPRSSAAAIAAGKATNTSPQKIEHLVRGYFGWLGIQALNAGDWVARPFMDLPGRPDRDMAKVENWFVVGDFVKSADANAGKYVTRLYEQQKQAEQAYAAFNLARQTGDKERAKELRGSDELRQHRIYKAADAQLDKLTRRAKRLANDRSITDKLRNEKLEEIELKKQKVSRDADEKVRKGLPAPVTADDED